MKSSVRTKIPQSLDLFCHSKTLLVINARLLWFCALGIVVFALPKITLQCDQHELNVGTVLGDLSDPLCLHVLEGFWRVDGEAQHDGMGIIIAEGA